MLDGRRHAGPSARVVQKKKKRLTGTGARARRNVDDDEFAVPVRRANHCGRGSPHFQLSSVWLWPIRRRPVTSCVVLLPQSPGVGVGEKIESKFQQGSSEATRRGSCLAVLVRRTWGPASRLCPTASRVVLLHASIIIATSTATTATTTTHPATHPLLLLQRPVPCIHHPGRRRRRPSKRAPASRLLLSLCATGHSSHAVLGGCTLRHRLQSCSTFHGQWCSTAHQVPRWFACPPPPTRFLDQDGGLRLDDG